MRQTIGPAWRLDPRNRRCTETCPSVYFIFPASLATDADHAFNDPKSEDPDPIFAAIGSQLTAGSKLVE
ncbi:MAG: hypothetical protein WD904_03550 [Dehalococcoidia bacterium]